METFFCKTLIELRKSRFLTQYELAELSGINEKYYGKIERGESFPTMKIFFYICNALDIPPSDFMLYMERLQDDL